MVENLKPSVRKDRQNTTPELAIEILEAAVLKCQAAGIRAGVREYHADGEHGIEIILLGVAMMPDKHLVIDSAINGN